MKELCIYCGEKEELYYCNQFPLFERRCEECWYDLLWDITEKISPETYYGYDSIYNYTTNKTNINDPSHLDIDGWVEESEEDE